jgi:hypothetical protein
MNVIAFLDGTSVTGVKVLPRVGDTTRRIAGTGDVNLDGRADIVWRDHTTGRNSVWYMKESVKQGEALLKPRSDVDWFIEQVSDFNKDGKPDFFWRNHSTGAHEIWYLDQTSHTGTDTVTSRPDTSWRIEN